MASEHESALKHYVKSGDRLGRENAAGGRRGNTLYRAWRSACRHRPVGRHMMDALGEAEPRHLLGEVINDVVGFRQGAFDTIGLLDTLPRRFAEKRLALLRRQINGGLMRCGDAKINRPRRGRRQGSTLACTLSWCWWRWRTSWRCRLPRLGSRREERCERR